MQGKVSSEPSAEPLVSVGIDTCKAWLDAHVLPADIVVRVPNTKKGHKQLMAKLSPYKVHIVVIEATGKHHRAAHRCLCEAGFRVAVVNPLRSRLFAEALGLLAKTDKVDARMLAAMGQMTDPKATPPLAENLENLREIVRSRDAAIANKVSLRNQLDTVTLDAVRSVIKKQITAADRAIEDLERQALKLIKADKMFTRRLVVLTSIPGIGGVTAIGLIANMPELGTLNEKAVGMLAGLAPIACESGQMRGARRI